MNAALRRPRARGSLVLAGNLSALAAWAFGFLHAAWAEVAAEPRDDMFDDLAVGVTGLVLWPLMAGSLVVAVVAAAFALPLGVVWARSERQPVLPGLSFAHALVAWGVVAVRLLVLTPRPV